MIGKQTSTEIKLENQLKEDGLDVIHQFHDGKKRVDLRVEDAKVDIEVDGIHHLTNPVQINKDLDRSYYSQKDGYSTIHIQNRDIRFHLKSIANALVKALRFRTKRRTHGSNKII